MGLKRAQNMKIVAKRILGIPSVLGAVCALYVLSAGPVLSWAGDSAIVDEIYKPISFLGDALSRSIQV